MSTPDVVRLDRPLVVGSGVAGLSTALALGRAVVVTKTAVGEGSSRWAQGGVASAVGADDDPEIHARDTLRVSGGLAVPDAVARLTAGGPAAVDRLIEIGAEFDRDIEGGLALGREAGHRARRIVHARGDATGGEIMRVLVEAVRRSSDLEVRTGVHVVDLLVADGGVAGVLVAGRAGAQAWLAPGVVLATGGIGQLYDRTTNPPEATGDGIAMAARAGARLTDMEFVQFHPTALDTGLDPMPLLTEALRGEGARLVTASGDRFMLGEHSDAELAPRDVVSRATYRRRGDAFLDARNISGLPSRFPTVFAAAARAGLDPRHDLLPVSPAAHYLMGGVDAASDGRTSLDGLYAVGEAASTGVHGANRLASNSLLEGLVFGRLTAEAILGSSFVPPSARAVAAAIGAASIAPGRGPAFGELRSVMWAGAGVERTASGLAAALGALESLEPGLAGWSEGRNALTVSRLVLQAALVRTESRGSHHRTDHPHEDPAQERRRSVTSPATLAVVLDAVAA